MGDIGPVGPSTGWGVVHLFFRVGPEVDPAMVRGAFKAAADHDVQVVTFAVLGHKADLGVMALGPDLWQLRRLQTDLVAAGLELTGSYVSLTEVSEYAAGMPEEMQHARLYPRLPPDGMPAICFYPMSKRRLEGQNWYTLPYEQRKELMYGHGAVGRTFAGRILQLITGSVGLDDWEWGVTLFGRHPDDLKEVVYKMRFDEASALYAEFGPFWTGLVAGIDDVLAGLGVG
ncbi:MAG TPA: chlorite dismutase family protein [Acidimicrobiales bacterium]|nr:chlorite dismutase family protein [Acidimicrobiales bacterium]